MFCTQCGGEVPEGSRFCIHCGEPMTAAPAQNNTEIPADLALEPPVIRRKGRIWPPILALVLIFAVGLGVFLCTQGYSAIASDPTMPWFVVERGTLYFDESLYTGGSELTVPQSIAGQPVTALSNGCFADCNRFVTIHLPEGLQTIGDGAFAGCDRLRGIKLPETVSYIGSLAFSDCRALEAICIPYSVQKTGAGVFEGCDSLRHIFYPGPIAAWEMLGINGLADQVTVYASEGAYPQG